jgi:hypothetical protein
MKAKALLTVVAGILLAGCSLRGKPAKSAIAPAAPKPVVTPAPAPPSPPLSIPQTRVELPKPQPVDPAALATEPKPPELPEPPPAAAPARPRRASPAAAQPASPAAAAPPAAAAAPPLEPRETFQEIVSPAEVKRLQDRALARRREANQILDQLGRRQLTGAEQNVAATIRNFLALSEEAEKHNDPRQADALAERAQILAKELQSGK